MRARTRSCSLVFSRVFMAAPELRSALCVRDALRPRSSRHSRTRTLRVGKRFTRLDVGQNLLRALVTLRSADVDAMARMEEGADMFSIGEPERKELLLERQASTRRNFAQDAFCRHVDSRVDVEISGRRLLLLEAQHSAARVDRNEAAIEASISGNDNHGHVRVRRAKITRKSGDIRVRVAIAVHDEYGIGSDEIDGVSQRAAGSQRCRLDGI